MTDQNAGKKESQRLRLALAAILPVLVIVYLISWGLETRIEMVSLAIPFLFILLDYLAFELKMQGASAQTDKKNWSYEPRTRIWGLGVLLGLGFLLLSEWSEIMANLGSETEGTISKAALTLGVFGLFVYGVVKVAAED